MHTMVQVLPVVHILALVQLVFTVIVQYSSAMLIREVNPFGTVPVFLVTVCCSFVGGRCQSQ